MKIFPSTQSTAAIVLLFATTTTLVQAQPSCVTLFDDELCLDLTFPTCTATWNGLSCESCTFCGEEEDAATAYRCEVAAIVSSPAADQQQPTCANDCANVECGGGCVGCQLAEADIPAAVEAYEAAQAAQLSEATEEPTTDEGDTGTAGDFPVPAPAPEADFPVFLPVEDLVTDFEEATSNMTNATNNATLPPMLPTETDAVDDEDETETAVVEQEETDSAVEETETDGTRDIDTEAEETADESGASWTRQTLGAVSFLWVVALVGLS